MSLQMATIQPVSYTHLDVYKRQGRHRVRIAVAHRSQTRYISTQFSLDSANQMKNVRVVKHENAANINACLRKLINEY